MLSLPVDRDEFQSLSILNSYRVKQGVLHNPRSDRRTTLGLFHIAEGSPISADKQAVPKGTFARVSWVMFWHPLASCSGCPLQGA